MKRARIRSKAKFPRRVARFVARLARGRARPPPGSRNGELSLDRAREEERRGRGDARGFPARRNGRILERRDGARSRLITGSARPWPAGNSRPVSFREPRARGREKVASPRSSIRSRATAILRRSRRGPCVLWSQAQNEARFDPDNTDQELQMNFVNEYALLFAAAIPVVAILAIQVYLFVAGERGTLLVPGFNRYPEIEPSREAHTVAPGPVLGETSPATASLAPTHRHTER